MEKYLEKTLKNYLDRRSFLKVMGVLGAGLLAPQAFSAPLEGIKFDKKLYKLEETQALMGTFVTITVLDPSRAKGEEAIEAGFNEMKRLINIFNRFDNGTVISELNKKGIVTHIPFEMQTVMQKSFYFYQLTNTCFDITVKPLVDLFKGTFAVRGKPPALEEIKNALNLVGMENISYANREIKFLKEGMGITLDGIAKGYIVDKTAELMAKMGIKHVLVNAGGDIRALGDKRWRIAIRNPFNPNSYMETINLKNNAIATSGNYEIYFDKEKIYHHVINPHTGYSPVKAVSASIVAKTTATADALSTAILILGPIKGKQFIDKLPGIEGLIITKNDVTLRSYGWGYYT